LPRGPGVWFFSFHCVKAFSVPLGLHGFQALAAPAAYDPQLLRLRSRLWRDRDVPRWGLLAVRKRPRQRHLTARRPLGHPQPSEGWPLHPRGGEKPPHPFPHEECGNDRHAGKAKEPKQTLGEREEGGESRPAGHRSVLSCSGAGGIPSAGAAGGLSLRSPRGPDARAVSGRRRRGGIRTPRGPDADRACPVAGRGACGRRGWGDARPHLATVAPAKQPPLRRKTRKASRGTQGANKKLPHSGKRSRTSEG
jgi:hypothetical protein